MENSWLKKFNRKKNIKFKIINRKKKIKFKIIKLNSKMIRYKNNMINKDIKNSNGNQKQIKFIKLKQMIKLKLIKNFKLRK